jgi:hypothetical protein
MSIWSDPWLPSGDARRPRNLPADDQALVYVCKPINTVQTALFGPIFTNKLGTLVLING